jgi:hypothetical protein
MITVEGRASRSILNLQSSLQEEMNAQSEHNLTEPISNSAAGG